MFIFAKIVCLSVYSIWHRTLKIKIFTYICISRSIFFSCKFKVNFVVSADWLLQADVSSRKNFLGAITGFGGTMRHTAYDLVTTSSYLKQGQIQMLSHGSLVKFFICFTLKYKIIFVWTLNKNSFKTSSKQAFNISFESLL